MILTCAELQAEEKSWKRDFNVRRSVEARSNAILIYALEKCLLSSGRE